MVTRKALKQFYQEIETMSLSKGDIAECKEIAREIIKEVMAEHVTTCPHNIRWKMAAAIITGACLGSGIAGGAGMAIAKLIMNM